MKKHQKHICRLFILLFTVISLATTYALADDVNYTSRTYLDGTTEMIEQRWECYPWWPMNDNPWITSNFADHSEDRGPGLDMKSNNTDVVASIEGTVQKIDYDADGYGNYVVTETYIGPVKYQITYAHLKDASLLKAGDTITRGGLIGTMGSTGNSTGPHLHFEVKRDGERIDPEQFLLGVSELLITPTF